MSDDKHVLIDPVRMSAALFIMLAGLQLVWGVTYWWLLRGGNFRVVWSTVIGNAVLAAAAIFLGWRILRLSRWARTVGEVWAALWAFSDIITLVGRDTLTRRPETLAGTLISLVMTVSILWLLNTQSAKQAFAKNRPAP